MKKKAVILFLSAMLAAGSLTGCGSLDENAVAVSVNDKELTADVANFYARYMQAQYEPIRAHIWVMICGTPRRKRERLMKSQ